MRQNISYSVAKYYANISGKNLENVPSDVFSAFNAITSIALANEYALNTAG